ncbi:hypothetical protein [Nocardia terpenica]|uniref:Uncharacterized protein n=1 Tax=Nocardia terpenica TaxID=455432 RepID=A0A6G9Z088_9NOCA|nr:hypothetical protein [Nocardia terpenica]QIS18995.1 hypothetical protein F6W96_12495 [Nocardia terpenica]
MDTELTFLGKGEIPHLLLGFTEKETFIGATMTDTGRGTFTLTGKPVTEPRLLTQLKIETYETAVEVSKVRREYYGGVEAA